jgi:hypothetical protein
MATSKGKRQVGFPLLVGIILALLAMGLPMVGVAVNLWLGTALLIGAFGLFVWGLWNWETYHSYGLAARLISLLILGIAYFGLIGLQIHSQYRKDHPTIANHPQGNEIDKPSKLACTGPTGNATASGPGSIANTGQCVSGLTTGQKPK